MASAKEIATALEKNGIRYNKDFARMDSEAPASEECHTFIGEMLEYLSKLVEHGVNNGFTSETKDAIRDITEMCLDLRMRNKNALKKLPAFKTSFEKIRVKLDLDNKNGLALRETVVKHLSSEIEGLEYLKSQLESNKYIEDADRKRRMARRDKQIARLKSILAAVQSVRDNISEDARALADQIIDKLCEASTMIVNETDMGPEVDALYDEATELAKKWQVCNIGSKKPAKEGIAFEVGVDPLAIVQSCIFNSEQTKEFKARLDEYEKKAGECEAKVKELEDKIKETSDQIKDIDAKVKQAAFDAKAGKITAVEFQRVYKDAQMRRARLDGKLKDYDAKIGEVRSRSYDKIDNIDVVRDIVACLEDAMEEGWERFYMVAVRFDFPTLSRLLRGMSPTQEEINSIQRMQAVCIELENQMREGTKGLKQTISGTKERFERRVEQETGVSYAEQRKQEEKEAEALLDSFLQDMDLGGGETPANVDIDEVLREDPETLKNER